MLGFRSKIVFILLILTLAYSTAGLSQEPAASPGATSTPSASESLLKEIRDILLLNINKLPIYLNQLTKMALSWLAPDNSNTTAMLQNNFTQLINAKEKNTQLQLDSQQKFLSGFLGKPSLITNSLAYPILLNKPYYVNTDPQSQIDPAYNYTQYASGLNMHHDAPLPNWFSDDTNARFRMYTSYYNTTSAVQTYNGYILSELYADAKNSNQAKKVQDTLIQEASNPAWFTQVASEKLGMVLRQILLYNSQTYVLLAQLLETQKKLLAAQVMNNSLLIAVNLEAENRMYNKAKNKVPD